MVYRFITLADIHWGAMDSQLTYDNLQLVLRFIEKMQGKIDFVVIAGDYFDYRIQLNSKTALLAVQWFDELIHTCKSNGVKKVRMLKGTREHDNDQLEVFRPPYETDDGFFRLFNTTTAEDLFDDLRVVYCPDENMNLEDYQMNYWDRFSRAIDIGFFHGNFDTILPSVEFNRIQEHHLATMIYRYYVFSRLIRGPLICGHWHVAQEYEAQYYVGSFDRWKFNEEDPKGFIYGEYDTDTYKYLIHRVTNPNARVYKTMIVLDADYRYPADFAILSDKVRLMLREDPEMKLRIVYVVSNPDEDILKTFNVFQQQFSNNRQIKTELKDLVKREQKKHRKETVALDSKQYGYIYNKDITAVPEIIRQFIRDKKKEDLPIEVIQKHVQKYLSQ